MKHLKMQTRNGIVFLSALLFLTSHAGAAELRKITFGYSSIGPMMHGLWMAKEIGAFEKHGLEAQLVFIASGPVVIQALLGGDLQAGLAATSAVIGAAAKGAAIVAVANMASRPYHRLWVQPEINRVEELRGKSLGITRFGSLPHNLTIILLRKYGLANAVNMRQFGDTLGIAAAFEQHVIAGAVTSELRVWVPGPSQGSYQPGGFRHPLFHKCDCGAARPLPAFPESCRSDGTGIHRWSRGAQKRQSQRIESRRAIYALHRPEVHREPIQ
jgi:ABC-type nitrate/sulfonate/bicarbonate transport system substrate-binding protein